MNVAIKFFLIFIVLLFFSAITVGFILSDATLHSIGGPVGKKAVALKRVIKIHITHPANTAIIGARSFWEELSRGTAFSIAPRVVLEIPEELREQFGKTRDVKPIRSTAKPGPKAESEQSQKPEPEKAPEPAKAPEPETKPKPAAKSEPAKASEPETKPKPAAKSEPAKAPEPETKPKPAAKSEPAKASEPETKPKPAIQTSEKAPANADSTGSAAHKEGLRHYKGDGVRRNFRTAGTWFKKAAAKGHAAAQYNLGIMAFSGQGMKVDLAAAVEWFQRAANQDYAPAQYNLGFLFYQGKGLQKDDLQAYTWMNRAAGLGYEKAKKARDLISRVIPKDNLKYYK